MAAYFETLVVLMTWVHYGTLQRAPVNSFYYQCNSTSVSLAVKTDPLGTGLLLDPSKLFLGQCGPSSTTILQGYIVFEYSLRDCGFSHLIYGNMVKYSVDLVYLPTGNNLQTFSQPFQEQINCSFTGSPSPTPSNLQVASQLSGTGALEFSAQIMKDDFSGPSDRKVFFLGSSIFVELNVLSGQHLPLQIYVDECTVAPSNNLRNAKQTYSLIQNHGCFVDGKDAASTFLPRVGPWSIRLSFEALSFKDLDSDLYLHFQVVVWDPMVVYNPSRKACSYFTDSARWVLLDNPTNSSLCNCCENVCQPLPSRKKRQVNDGNEQEGGLVHTMVLGPFRVETTAAVGSHHSNLNNSGTTANPDRFPIPPAVGALLLEVALLLVMSVGVVVYSRTTKKKQEDRDKRCLIHEIKPQSS
ncbi:hypothetical protein GDO86_001716 [Hymenochirus boettgeri]|uniref:ZP domain-containing protein n=1 Tax=Hymenochirus boettgeri TaxID=247094 RepID=A0A8T2KJP6_9PIPI|nr:hypothetical protein GDO86_001716 [Hymenochirus boettgeri]